MGWGSGLEECRGEGIVACKLGGGVGDVSKSFWFHPCLAMWSECGHKKLEDCSHLHC